MPDPTPQIVSRLVRYATVMPSIHRGLLELVNGHIADGDDSEALMTMRDLLEHAEVVDVNTHRLLAWRP